MHTPVMLSGAVSTHRIIYTLGLLQVPQEFTRPMRWANLSSSKLFNPLLGDPQEANLGSPAILADQEGDWQRTSHLSTGLSHSSVLELLPSPTTCIKSIHKNVYNICKNVKHNQPSSPLEPQSCILCFLPFFSLTGILCMYISLLIHVILHDLCSQSRK